MILHIYTIIHTLISLVAIFTGFVVLFAMLCGGRAKGWTRWFLITAVATTVTGFFFPFHGLTPAFTLGIITVPILVLAIYARYYGKLVRQWRWIYIVCALLTLYLNVFVGIVQSFQKVPALKALAPTQTERPFVASQVTALSIFVLLTIAAIIRFRIEEGSIDS